uniref:Uncharacterized protein n=1 Tax=Anguilla anguilla TaxID=7936 RepID=A0A0E9QNR5_ANGAN
MLQDKIVKSHNECRVYDLLSHDLLHTTVQGCVMFHMFY